jgi:hypothetical protein
LKPLIEQFSDQLPVIFAYLQGNLDSEPRETLQKLMDSDPALRHLIQAMQGSFSH